MNNKSPPISRKQKMVQEAIRMASDPRYGYSQKPPSGRWGPDFDCSSLIYYLADYAGYPVGIGGGKVRFTGTMLKDFEKAGFQILPFANVGVSDLQIGDVLLNLALHAEIYVGDGETVGATASEDGTYIGKAGDQTGTEIEKHPVLTFDKGWDYVLRPPEYDEDYEDVEEEGDDEMPMNYGPAPMTQNQPWNTQGQPWGMNNGYPQGGMMPYQQGYGMNNRMMPNQYGMQGYPQGNLGQMNGYSQANAGYPQSNMQQPMGPQGMDNDLCFVMGIEGAKNVSGMPNSRKAVFDEDKPIFYIVSFDQNGTVNDIHVYSFEECSEEFPQHLSPLMRNNQNNNMGMGDLVTRAELEELKEMLTNGKSSNEQQTRSRNGNQQPGSKLNARTN